MKTKDPKLEINANLGIDIEFLGNSKHKVAGSVNIVRDLSFNDDHTTVLLDCGLTQTNDLHHDYVDNKQIFSKFKPSELDAVIISHTHLDHVGLLPALYNNGFTGTIYIPKGTTKILKLLLLDSAYIQEIMSEQLSTNNHTVTPLYNVRNVLQVIENMVEVGLKEEIHINDNVSFKYHNAGHILHSRMIELKFNRINPGNSKKILYTGDLGDNIRIKELSPGKNFSKLFYTRDDNVFDNYYDLVIMESTYGDRPANSQDFDVDLDMLLDATENFRKIIIPAFAQSRTFEILYVLYMKLSQKALDEFEIIVDSPLGTKLTLEYSSILYYHDEEFAKWVKNDIYYPERKEDSIAAMAHSNKQIILTSAGMLTGGRSVYWVEDNIEEQDSCIIFSGYVSPNSPGFRVLDKSPAVELRGYVFGKRAVINQFKSFSSHIHQGQIIYLCEKLSKANCKTIIFTHGDKKAKMELKEELNKLETMDKMNIYDSSEI